MCVSVIPYVSHFVHDLVSRRNFITPDTRIRNEIRFRDAFHPIRMSGNTQKARRELRNTKCDRPQYTIWMNEWRYRKCHIKLALKAKQKIWKLMAKMEMIERGNTFWNTAVRSGYYIVSALRIRKCLLAIHLETQINFGSSLFLSKRLSCRRLPSHRLLLLVYSANIRV